jgi:hypothetical protein
MKGAALALECSSLLPLSSSEPARPSADRIGKSDGQQAGQVESGSKLLHSKAGLSPGKQTVRGLAESSHRLPRGRGLEDARGLHIALLLYMLAPYRMERNQFAVGEFEVRMRAVKFLNEVTKW